MLLPSAYDSTNDAYHLQYMQQIHDIHPSSLNIMKWGVVVNGGNILHNDLIKFS